MVNGVLNTTQWGPHGLQQYNYSSVPIPTEGASEDFNFQFQPEGKISCYHQSATVTGTIANSVQ